MLRSFLPRFADSASSVGLTKLRLAFEFIAPELLDALALLPFGAFLVPEIPNQVPHHQQRESRKGDEDGRDTGRHGRGWIGIQAWQLNVRQNRTQK